jgi:hypothetical protein
MKEAGDQLCFAPAARVILLGTSNDSGLRKPAGIVAALLAESWALRDGLSA